MAEKSGFFNSMNGDRRYSASFLAEWLDALISTGIRNGGTNLQVSSAGTSFGVKVAPGKAWIRGYYYNNEDASIDLQPEQAELSITRIDRVILRLDLSLPYRKIYLYVKRGTTQPPALDRNIGAGFWEISLARLEILPNTTTIPASRVIDERLNTDVCGIANSLITADTTAIFNAFNSYYNEKRAEFEANFQTIQAAWDLFFGTSSTTGIRGEWNAWFNQVKANLGQVNVFDFDNWARMPGFEYELTVNSSSSFTHVLRNTANQSVFATRTTTRNADGSIVTTVSCPSVLGSDVKSTMTFPASNKVLRKVVNV